MDNFLHNKYGCWIAGGLTFDNKVKALEYASKTKSTVRFYYHDHIWNSFDRSLLGKIPLPLLYKERAQQLRDSYDYLILYYSGGSDSHNILQTFLRNNIKLDEVRVRWAKPLVDGKFYEANTQDFSARNGVSEWDFCIRPELEKLKSSHPDIKINVVDYTNRLLSFNDSVEAIEKTLNDYRWYRGAFQSFVQRFDKEIYRPVGKGKEGHIFGIEKPILQISDKTIDLVFLDQFLENTSLPLNYFNNEIECFYWSPDFPILPLEQAYQVALYVKQQKLIENGMLDRLDYIFTDSIENFSPESFASRYKTNSLVYIQKEILFKDTWDNSKFSAGKPNDARSDWYFWLHESPEFNRLKLNYDQAMANVLGSIDSTLLLQAENSTMLIPRKTMPFKILSL